MARGYAITLTMPDTKADRTAQSIVALGAKILLTEGDQGMAGSIAKALELVASDPAHYVLLQQFENPANPRIHFETTGPEIWNDTGGNVTYWWPVSAPEGRSRVSRAISSSRKRRRFFGGE